jgi:hypothetical protein
MTIHLTKFVDRVRAQESRGAKDFVMSMTDAKELHADITRLMLELHALRESPRNDDQNSVIQVKMTGGSF